MTSKNHLDLTQLVETPENVALPVVLAGPIPRLRAWIIDALIRYGILLVAWIFLGILGQAGVGIGLIFMFLLNWFYPVYFELRSEGQTPGKKVAGIRVVHEDLTPLTFGSSFLRNLLRVADMLPVGYIVGLACMILGRKFQRAGDIVAGTWVVHVQHSSKTPQIQASPVAWNFPLTPVEHDAFVRFAMRRQRLHPSRQKELAEIVAPMIPSSIEPVERVEGVAAWLLGHRKDDAKEHS